MWIQVSSHLIFIYFITLNISIVASEDIRRLKHVLLEYSHYLIERICAGEQCWVGSLISYSRKMLSLPSKRTKTRRSCFGHYVQPATPKVSALRQSVCIPLYSSSLPGVILALAVIVHPKAKIKWWKSLNPYWKLKSQKIE